jgi:alpha-L-fucosidase
MKRFSVIILGVLLAAAQLASAEPARAPDIESLKPTAAEREARLGWWREARFGMFVHWGVYSGLSGTWNGKAYGGYAEHIQRMAKIPCAVYRKEVAGTFNPTGFNADEWIRLAKEAGMGYFVITAKHHDGFAMFNSQVSDYNIVRATPFARDPMKELQAACKKYGVRFGFYYSHAFDWGEANGPGNDWDYQNPGGDKLLHGANWWEKFPEFLPQARKYVDEKSIPQLQELIKNYDPDIIWFDTPHKLPPEENLRILAAVRKAKPSLVVNGRLVRGAGDYDSTCDRPAEFPAHDGDWEGVPTTNESYGYNQNDHSHKPPAHFIQLLAKSAARGGNELMNIGPMGNGKMDPADIAILKGIGAWWQLHGESIRGTTRTPLAVQAWGESTLRQGSGLARKGNTLYLHVFDWPRDGRLVIGGLKSEVKLAWLLRDKANTIYTHLKAVRVSPLDVRIEGLPKEAPDAADSIIAVECVGEPQTDPARLLATNLEANTLRGFDAKLQGKLQFGPGKTKDAWVTNWTKKDDAVVWPLRLNAKATFDLTLIYDAPKDSKGGKVKEGDAGKERVRANKGAGGTYVVKLGTQAVEHKVRSGDNVRDALGKVTLEPGAFEIRVTAKEITGEELLRLRALVLKPVSD